MLIKNGNVVTINEELFTIGDVQSVVKEYSGFENYIHYYDGKKHYTSNGKNQLARPVPCDICEKVLASILEIRLCKKQRETDKKHFESLRNVRR